MNYQEKLLQAINYFESLGNTIEEFGELLEKAKRDYIVPISEDTNNARIRIKEMPFGLEILRTEMNNPFFL